MPNHRNLDRNFWAELDAEGQMVLYVHGGVKEPGEEIQLEVHMRHPDINQTKVLTIKGMTGLNGVPLLLVNIKGGTAVSSIDGVGHQIIVTQEG